MEGGLWSTTQNVCGQVASGFKLWEVNINEGDAEQ